MFCLWGKRFEFDIVDPVESYPSSKEGMKNFIFSPHPVTRKSVKHSQCPSPQHDVSAFSSTPTGNASTNHHPSLIVRRGPSFQPL
jgi:hypothetical protein